jgi:hypothetical protein
VFSCCSFDWVNLWAQKHPRQRRHSSAVYCIFPSRWFIWWLCSEPPLTARTGALPSPAPVGSTKSPPYSQPGVRMSMGGRPPVGPGERAPFVQEPAVFR